MRYRPVSVAAGRAPQAAQHLRGDVAHPARSITYSVFSCHENSAPIETRPTLLDRGAPYEKSKVRKMRRRFQREYRVDEAISLRRPDNRGQ
jgi:hypothetical protein